MTLDPIQTAIAHAKDGLDLEVFSARSLRAAKKAIKAEWPVRRIISEREGARRADAAIARIDEELNARELDGRTAPQAQRTRGFKV